MARALYEFHTKQYQMNTHHLFVYQAQHLLAQILTALAHDTVILFVKMVQIAQNERKKK